MFHHHWQAFAGEIEGKLLAFAAYLELGICGRDMVSKARNI